MSYPRVAITDQACKIVDKLRVLHGPLLFHQSGGCCDGSSPMCFSINEFKLGSNDLLLGTVCDCAFYMDMDQFQYWQHTHLTVDVIEGRASSFSLEVPLGMHFVVVSRLYSEQEYADLEPITAAVSQ